MDKPIQYIRYDQTLVEAACLPEETRRLLLEQGLPQLRHNDEDVLGVHFQPRTDRDFITDKEGKLKLFPIGYEWEESAAWLCVETGTGRVCTMDAETGELGQINTSLAAFVEFLKRYADVMQQFSTREEPTILTAEQARLKLEAFRRGEIKPGNKSTSIAAREKAVQELRAYYIEKDPASLASEDAWWSVVLEQLEDHLL